VEPWLLEYALSGSCTRTAAGDINDSICKSDINIAR